MPRIESERIKVIRDLPPVTTGRYVLYWMQASQRVDYNHALVYAIERANELNLSVVVYFGLTDDYPMANWRHYQFMLEGLQEVQRELKTRGIPMVVRRESPEKGVIKLCKDAALLVMDRGYLKVQRRWRAQVAKKVKVSCVQVESECVVPIETASDKQEYAAATLRPKIHRQLKKFLKPLRMPKAKKSGMRLSFEGIALDDVEKVLATLKIDRSVRPAPVFIGGTSEARKRLHTFIRMRLADYDQARNDPNVDGTSDLSPYLHFGQISPVRIALELSKRRGKGVAAFLEELIVRRELAMNFVYFNRDYDTIKSLPNWAAKTLKKHERDKRPYRYSRAQLEQAKTHDPYWNAAQLQMVHAGKMHGYMRMYWGKKILEWTKSPRVAWQRALYLNDTYELDGRDPNGYTGVAWCFGVHDRPWQERPIFGMVRYMNDAGLRRKFDADSYVRKVEEMGVDPDLNDG